MGEICIDDLKEKIHFINHYVEKFISDYENKVDSKGMNLINNIKEICNEALKDDNKIYTNKYIENLQDEYKNKFIKFINKIYEEEKIIDYLLKKDIYAIEIFNFNIDSIYNIFSDDILKINEIAKTIFKNIILGVYKKLIWLKDYINIEFFNEKNIYAIKILRILKRYTLKK